MPYELGRSITKLFKYEKWWVDKSKAEGSVVTLRDNKIEICGLRGTPLGVYTAGSKRKVLLFSGEKLEIEIPESIIISGVAQVKMAKK